MRQVQHKVDKQAESPEQVEGVLPEAFCRMLEREKERETEQPKIYSIEGILSYLIFSGSSDLVGF